MEVFQLPPSFPASSSPDCGHSVPEVKGELHKSVPEDQGHEVPRAVVPVAVVKHEAGGGEGPEHHLHLARAPGAELSPSSRRSPGAR